ncbi:VanZ family protein [Novilysobacter arseniciresistens]|uniref:VanZ family protein n=1 Tax=Novilysobacter arseniciresistens TaxID=1385522 RepID=UPI000691BAA7|nr:VanZ family protein [Lysobacter arseniciresistens]
MSSQAPPRALRAFRRPWLWIGLWVALFALVALGSLWNADALPAPSFEGIDKVQHFIGYAVLSAWAVMLFARMRAQALAALVVIAFGIATEVAQGVLTTDRSADSADAMANALGALAGLLLSPTPLAGTLQRLDARWSRKPG